ncbi:MAG: terminase small subunit [Chitinispirillia bacterium]|nr:terminase small subunit [Chitinispirillia bacterium]MCL2241285.1 terminase small subunit [Chitinispirillia bacterium]
MAAKAQKPAKKTSATPTPRKPPVRSADDAMCEKHKAFCEEYLKDLNATRAYQASHPGAVSYYGAAASASKLLKNPKVSAYIQEVLAALRSERIADANEVLEMLTSTARGLSESEVVVVLGQGEGRSEEKTVKKLPDQVEMTKAQELLGKRYGLFKESVSVDHTSGGQPLPPLIILPDNDSYNPVDVDEGDN